MVAPAIVLLLLLRTTNGLITNSKESTVLQGPLPSCEAHYDAGSTADGVYPITVNHIDGSTTTENLYCDMVNGGWTLVGKVSGKHEMAGQWLRQDNNVAELTTTTIALDTWASIDAIDMAVNYATEVRLSNQDISKYVRWPMHTARDTATWWDHSAGCGAAVAGDEVTVTDQDSATGTCYANAVGIMGPYCGHGGSYPYADYNFGGNTISKDLCMGVGVMLAATGTVNGYWQNGNGFDEPSSDTDWPNDALGSDAFVNVWLGFTHRTLSPTLTPTPAPPAPATGAASGNGAASAKGDPHLQNVNGQKFDLMRPGRHVLLHIPLGAGAPHILLRVVADVQRLGVQCADLYFHDINITGAWIEGKHDGILQFHAGDVDDKAEPTWMTLGAVDLKVVHAQTKWGINYLNIYAKHLGKTGFQVGGLLGEDDHTIEATPDQGCVPTLSLHGAMPDAYSARDVTYSASSAEASFA